MAGQPLPFVFGGGVSCTYNGPEVCAPFSYEAYEIKVPYWNPVLREIAYNTIPFQRISSQEGGNDLMNYVGMLWEVVSAKFAAYNLTDPMLSITTLLTEGLNESPLGEAHANQMKADITLISTDPNIDKWWQTKDFGKFGYFCWQDDVFRHNDMPVQWINTELSAFQAQQPKNGWRVFLQPKCWGVIKTYGRLLPPPITWSGGGSGSYPPT